MKIAFNINDTKPACWNLQRMYDGTPKLASEFPTHTWDLTPSDKIGTYEITEKQLEFLVKKVEAKHGKG